MALILPPTEQNPIKFFIIMRIKRIYKTKLKFVESEKTGEMISFVNGGKSNQLRGVHENEDVPKQIVLIGKDIAGSIEVKPKVLYDVQLIPMKKHGGYLVVDLSASQFSAEIESEADRINIVFGNKTIIYEPRNLKPSIGTIDGIVAVLNKRIDLKDKDLVIQSFKDRSQELLSAMAEKDEEDKQLLLTGLKQKYAHTA